MGRAVVIVLVTSLLFLGGFILWDFLIPYLPQSDAPISLASLYTFFLIILLINPETTRLGDIKQPRLKILVVSLLAGLTAFLGKGLYLAYFTQGLENISFSVSVDWKTVMMSSLATAILAFLISLSKIFSLRGKKGILPFALFILFFAAVLYFGKDYPWLQR